jgi:hypothetical protein
MISHRGWQSMNLVVKKSRSTHIACPGFSFHRKRAPLFFTAAGNFSGLWAAAEAA